MAANLGIPNGGLPLLVVGDSGGITVVDTATPLRRLNYFDGKFLRADDFNVEQSYLRQLVALSNQGLGAGLVYGFDTVLGSGDTLQVGPGLAIDPAGKVLLLQKTVTQGVQALIDATRQVAAAPTDDSGKPGGFGDCVEVAAPAPTTVLQTGELYVIAVCAAEALCGQEDVFGIACQDACVAASDRPYRLDGIVLRALPLQLVTPLATSDEVAIDADRYLRSKVAQAWFTDERLRHPDAISAAGLQSQLWCLGAGYASGCCEVPLAVVARDGARTLFLDAWIVRRERMTAPARRYWQWKMRMRPWDVYLAQVLQFQCQLADALAGVGAAPTGAQAAAHRALDEAAHFVAQVREGLAAFRGTGAAATLDARPALLSLSLTQVSDLQQRLSAALQAGLAPVRPTQRVLLGLGLVELPSGGYLPVLNGSAPSVNDQVRALMGEGVDLRFCITTADFIAHAIEQAQHMERISLLEGLHDPQARPKVDVWVPDGIASGRGVSAAGLYDAVLGFSAQQTGGLATRGAARVETLAGGGTALYSAGAGLSQLAVPKMQALARAIVRPAAGRTATVTANLQANAFVRKTAALGARLDVKVAGAAGTAREAITAGGLAAAGGTFDGSGAAARASSAGETVDGVWIDARVDERIAGLGVGGHTALRLRLVVATRPATPLAFELAFTGTLTVTGASSTQGVLQQDGTLNGVLTVGVLQEDQAQQRSIEYELTQRYNWPARLTHAGDAGSGTVTLELDFGTRDGTRLRLARTTAGQGVQIVHQLALVVPGKPNAAGAPGSDTVTPLGQLVLSADAGLADPANPFHQYARSGVALVQAALVVSEPGFEAQAASLLFPDAAGGGAELVIRAVRDWVAFTRRRERQCAPDAPPPPALPARRYRVIEHTADSLDDAQSSIGQFQQALKDPAVLAQVLQTLLKSSDRQDKLHLVVSYAGGSAQALSNLADVQADWKTFNPGHGIAYAAIGALGESDAALQLARLATFKTAVKPDSAETGRVPEDVIVPFPEEGQPEDADGVLVVITVRDAPPPPPPPVVKNALLTVGHLPLPSGATPPYFQPGALIASMKFEADAPRGSELQDFAGKLSPNTRFVSVTLWSTAASLDDGAQARVRVVRDAVAQAHRLAADAPCSAKVLTEPLRRRLEELGIALAGIDDVIAVETPTD